MRTLFAFVVGCSIGPLAPAMAAPLDAAGCAAATAELQALEGQGLRTLYEQGAAAAKSNASREQLERMRRYIDLLGVTRFRCPSEQPFVTLRPEPTEDPAEAAALNAPIEAGAAGVTLPAGAQAVVAPVRPKRPAPAKAEAGATTPPAKPTAPPRPKPAPAKTAAPPAEPKTPPAGAQPSAKAAAVSAAAKPPVEGAKAPPPSPPPKARPKVDDAFRPPIPAGAQ
jgi:hypothetical protein